MNSAYMKPVINTNWVYDMPGWRPSDPQEQGWKNHMFDTVDTSYGLPRWGPSTGVISLPPVPKAPGASPNEAYLYLKDCGEFDTQTYAEDREYMKFAFGVPSGVTGKDANNYIDNILITKVGINTTGPTGSGSGSATGNRNGLHAYNDYDWNLWSREISAVDGDVLSFGWSFQGGNATSGNDAAFWILKSSTTDKIISAGLLAQGSNPASGIANITIPESSTGYENYVLTIGQMNVGKYNSDQANHNPHMLVGQIVQKSLVPPPPLDTDLDNLLDWGAFEDGFDVDEWAGAYGIVKTAEACLEEIDIVGGDPEMFDPGA